MYPKNLPQFCRVMENRGRWSRKKKDNIAVLFQRLDGQFRKCSEEALVARDVPKQN